MKVERIMSEKKSTLPWLRNQDWKTVKVETKKKKNQKKKKNELFTHISTDSITELNELIYAEAKVVCGKIGVPQKNTKGNLKLGWDIRLETRIRKLRLQAKMIRQRKTLEYVGTKRQMQRNN